MSIEPEVLNGRDVTMGAEHGIPSGERNEREIVVRAEPQLPALPEEMSLEQVAQRVDKVRELHKRLMKPDIHFGVIPGTQKPTLLKPGAELILMTFMLDPQYTYEVKQDGPHREIFSTCTLYHIPTGRRVASGVGMCSTKESKYRWRYESKCPECEQLTLMRSKFASNGFAVGSWYCNPRRGGCGGQFQKSDPRIKAGQQENPDIADQYNTVLKMASKRSLIDASLKATAASEAYTQDIGDDEDDGEDTSAASRTDNNKKVETQRSGQINKTEAAKRSAPAAASAVADTGSAEPESTQEAEPVASDSAEKVAVDSGATAANRPAANPTTTGPALSQGHINLLKKMLQNAKLIENDEAILNTMTWLSDSQLSKLSFGIELVYDDQKSADENLVATLRMIPISKVGEVRTAIQEKGKENS